MSRSSFEDASSPVIALKRKCIHARQIQVPKQSDRHRLEHIVLAEILSVIISITMHIDSCGICVQQVQADKMCHDLRPVQVKLSNKYDCNGQNITVKGLAKA